MVYIGLRTLVWYTYTPYGTFAPPPPCTRERLFIRKSMANAATNTARNERWLDVERLIH